MQKKKGKFNRWNVVHSEKISARSEQIDRCPILVVSRYFLLLLPRNPNINYLRSNKAHIHNRPLPRNDSSCHSRTPVHEHAPGAPRAVTLVPAAPCERITSISHSLKSTLTPIVL
ncbi:hypothetical protein EVAR_49330_1 [Eumeta japonica]|uniref:Uncharacterized protein n=1 Tax=Eumeta variegata TaxID=151549 RepID=A0A4C1YCF4_EUMVA|nr:hypothetical protein EVAR_49330_1 [Eumeta japonica]